MVCPQEKYVTRVGRVPRLSGNNQQFQVHFWEHGKIRIGKFHPSFGTGVETDLQF
jgi:hypothetical protein